MTPVIEKDKGCYRIKEKTEKPCLRKDRYQGSLGKLEKPANIYSPCGSIVRMLWFPLFCSGVKNSIVIQTPTELGMIDLVS